MVDYRLTEEQVALQKMTHEFAEREVRPIAMEIDHDPDPAKSAYIPYLLEKADKVGLRTMAIPEKYGGGGVDDLFTQCLVGEELSWGDRGMCGMLLSATKITHILSAEDLAPCACEENREKWLREYVNDPTFLVSTATTEPDTGSENMLPDFNDPAGGYRTTAVRDGDDYVINGTKIFVSHIGHARLNFVFLRTDPSKGVHDGASAFMIPIDAPGVSFGRVYDKIGYRLNLNRELILDNCRVPASLRLGPENYGLKNILKHIRGDTLINAASMVGLARAAYETTLEYARNRVQSGKPIIEHQTIAVKLLDMWTQIQSTRAYVWQAAWAVDCAWHGIDGGKIPIDPKLANSASYLAHEMCVDVCRAAMEIHGGIGAMRDYPIEMYMRNAVCMLHSDGGVINKRIRILHGL
ncbi:acyl-CoA dehydrogenase family protein [Nitrospinota bacterium]